MEDEGLPDTKDLVCISEHPLCQESRAHPKKKTREIHTKITEDDHEFLLDAFGVGYMSRGIRAMIGRFRKTKGNPIQALQKEEEMHLQEAEHCRVRRLELEAEVAQKEKEEHDLAAKHDEIISVLVKASRRHAKTDPLLWQTAFKKSGIPVLELRKIVKEKLKESELNEN